MEVLIISHAAGIPEVGPNLRTFYLARKLVAMGHSVNVVGAGYFHKYIQAPQGRYRIVDGVKYTWLSSRPYQGKLGQIYNQLEFAWRLWAAGNNLIVNKPAVVLFSSPPPLAIYAAVRIAKKNKAKLVFEIRDLWPEIIQELSGRSARNPYFAMVNHAVRYGYAASDAVVSTKPGDVGHIKKHYRHQGRVQCIPNGFDVTEVIDGIYPRGEFSEGVFKIVYVGALSAYYDLSPLLKALQSFDDDKVKLYIIGDGEDRGKYETLVYDLNLKNVSFLGRIPKNQILSVLRRCDLAYVGLKDVASNRFGISTNKLYEYFYAKIPVLGVYRTDHDVLVPSGAGLVVPSGQAKEVAEAIGRFAAMSSSDRKRMGENGFRLLHTNHTFEQIAKQYECLFETLILT